jgi:hypothetical protein
MNDRSALRLAALALHKQLGLPVSRVSVWGWWENGRETLVVELAPGAPASYRSKIPTIFRGFAVEIRSKLNPIADFKETIHACRL